MREFIAWLSLRQLAPATIATYIAGVAHYHKLNGFPDPTQDLLVFKLLEGCRRGRSQADKRLPINPTFLSEIIHALSHVCVSQFESTLFRAAMLTAFFGFMRIGEFAANSSHCMQESLLQLSDVHFDDLETSAASVRISFRNTKTNKTGPPQTICLVQSAEVSFCPVPALSDFALV